MSASMPVTSSEIQCDQCGVFNERLGRKVSSFCGHIYCLPFSITVPEIISTSGKIEELWLMNRKVCMDMIESLGKRLEALEISEYPRVEGKYQKDWVEAMRLVAFPPAAQAGSPEALYAIGRLLWKEQLWEKPLQDLGMSIDPMVYLKQAAEAGHLSAQAFYGHGLFCKGRPLAQKFLASSAIDKNVWGLFFYALHNQYSDRVFAQQYLLTAAKKGFALAQYECAGKLHSAGFLEDALVYYKRASRQGHRDANTAIGEVRDQLEKERAAALRQRIS